jgi:hypothetical protein
MGRFPGLDPGSHVRGTALTNDQDFLKLLGAEPYQSRFGPFGAATTSLGNELKPP